MIKVNIININEFLRTVNSCTGAVYMLTPGRGKEDINKEYGIQDCLRRQHRDNRQYLPLILDIPNYRDYLDIINFYAGDV